jgi:hypothetical protein
MLERVLKVRFLWVVALGFFVPGMASAQLIESWENTLDGWTVNPSFNNQAGFTSGFSSTTGVTNGSYSLAITSAGETSPDYGQLLYSPSTLALTNILANASSLSLDVDTSPGAFGYYAAFDFDINNAATGYESLDGYDYMGTAIGSEYTFTIPISPSIASALAASNDPTSINIQLGGGSGAGTLFLDNLRATPVPEPVSIGAIVSGVSLLALRRHRKAVAI